VRLPRHNTPVNYQSAAPREPTDSAASVYGFSFPPLVRAPVVRPHHPGQRCAVVRSRIANALLPLVSTRSGKAIQERPFLGRALSSQSLATCASAARNSPCTLKDGTTLRAFFRSSAKSSSLMGTPFPRCGVALALGKSNRDSPRGQHVSCHQNL